MTTPRSATPASRGWPTRRPSRSGACPPRTGNAPYYAGIFDAGTTHDYHVYYSFTDGMVRMAADGQVLDISPSVDGHWSPGWTGQFFGETWDRSDNVPGTVANKTDFRRLKTLTCRGCSYGSPQGATPLSSLSVYKFEWVNKPVAFNIWTQR